MKQPIHTTLSEDVHRLLQRLADEKKSTMGEVLETAILYYNKNNIEIDEESKMILTSIQQVTGLRLSTIIRSALANYYIHLKFNTCHAVTENIRQDAL